MTEGGMAELGEGMGMGTELQAPFPWFGGKARVAPLVWAKFGNVPNYVEPFLGSGAVLLGRPSQPHIETVNDRDGFIANFFRAMAADPEGLARECDLPVNEADLHARHLWLVGRREDLTAHLMGDPEFYDLRVAGWWVWGICSWIGGGWCSGKGPWTAVDGRLVLRSDDSSVLGVNRKLPHLGDAGHGVNRQRPHLGNMGNGVNGQAPALDWFRALAKRLHRVRVCCGDWQRVCGYSPTTKLGLTGLFLDPPYSTRAGRCDGLYACEDLSVAQSVGAWCRERGADPLLRIALCGYEGEHDLPGWECIPWQAAGGYSSLGDGAGRENKYRERIWFSPACLRGGRLL